MKPPQGLGEDNNLHLIITADRVCNRCRGYGNLIKEDLFILFYKHRLNTFLKSDTNIFSLDYKIIFKFSDTNYIVDEQLEENSQIEKSYGDFLTEQEMEYFMNSIAEKIYVNIENNLKNSSI